MPNSNLIAIIDSYGCMPEYNDMKAFFNNDANNQAIQDAINKYGMPVANTKSYHTGWSIFGKWHDPCDWQNIGKFYAYAKLCSQYPNLTNSSDGNMCTMSKDAVPTLQTMLNSVNATYTNPNQRTSVTNAITDKINEYKSFYTKNNCDSTIASQTASNAVSGSTTAVANTFTNIVQKYGVYIIGGVALYLFIKSRKS
jgi:hypothetical protein